MKKHLLYAILPPGMESWWVDSTGRARQAQLVVCGGGGNISGAVRAQDEDEE